MTNIENLTEFVTSTINETSYPGFESRSFKLGLPLEYNNAPTSLFLLALKSDNIYVQLAALRWFQEKPNQAFSHQEAIMNFLKSNDEWLRFESIKTIQKMHSPKISFAKAISPLIFDESVFVKQEAIKAISKIMVKLKSQDNEILASLEKAALDKDHEVKRKALKAIRLIKQR